MAIITEVTVEAQNAIIRLSFDQIIHDFTPIHNPYDWPKLVQMVCMILIITVGKSL